MGGAFHGVRLGDSSIVGTALRNKFPGRNKGIQKPGPGANNPLGVPYSLLPLLAARFVGRNRRRGSAGFTEVVTRMQQLLGLSSTKSCSSGGPSWALCCREEGKVSVPHRGREKGPPPLARVPEGERQSKGGKN